MDRLQTSIAILVFTIVLSPVAAADDPSVITKVGSVATSTQDTNKDGLPDTASLVATETVTGWTCLDPQSGRQPCSSTTTVWARDTDGDGVPDDVSGNALLARAQGDPIHGVDVKLGASAAGLGDPIHGVDVKLGASAARAGDPIHGVDVKLGVR